MPRKTLTYLILFCFCNLSIGAKDLLTNQLIETKVHYGFLWPHHSSIEYVITGHVPAFEVNVLKQNINQHIWDDLFRNPRTGFGLSYFYMEDHDILGSAIGTYGIFDVSLVQTKRFTESYRFYGGLSWLTNIWNIDNNVLQTAIGSHVNLYFRLALTSYIQLGPKSEATFDAGFTHFSNGNVKRPNLGLNFPTLSAGYIYKFNTEPFIDRSPEPPAYSKWNLNFASYHGFKAERLYENEYYYKSSFSILYGYNLNIKRQIGIGADFMYDGAYKEVWPEEDVGNFGSLMQGGFIIYHDLRYNKLVLTIQIGAYVFNNHNYREIYNRNGLKYYFRKNLFGTVALKSHKTQADYIEWGIGYTL